MALGNLSKRILGHPEFIGRTRLKQSESLRDMMQELQLYGKMINIAVAMGSYWLQESSTL